MTIDPNQTRERTAAARAAIQAPYGTAEGEYGPTLFVSHHLDAIEPEYWEMQFQSPSPEPKRILNALILASAPCSCGLVEQW